MRNGWVCLLIRCGHVRGVEQSEHAEEGALGQDGLLQVGGQAEAADHFEGQVAAGRVAHGDEDVVAQTVEQARPLLVQGKAAAL